MVIAALGLGLGILAASAGRAGPPWLLAPLALGGLIGFLTLRQRPSSGAVALAILFTAGGALFWIARHEASGGDALSRDAALQDATTPYVLEGRVDSPDIWLPGQDYFVFVLRVDTVERADQRLRAPGGVLVRWSNPGRPLFERERVRVSGPIELTIGPVNPGVHGMEDYYRRYGVHSAVRISGANAVQSLGNPPRFSLVYGSSRFRGYLARRIAEVVPASSLPLVLTIWLGDRRRLDTETYQTFIDSGTAHVLAVSGVHVSLMFVTLTVLFPPGPDLRRARIRAVWMLLIIAAFVVVTGGRVSSVRAALMVAVYVAADWFGRERDAPTALAIAGIGFLVWEPELLFDVGFQLSFLSVASILVFGEAFGNAAEWVPIRLRFPAVATIAVQLLPLPFAIRAFHVLPLIAPLSNLVVIPVTTVLLWIGFVAALAAIAIPPAAVIFGQTLHLLAQATLWMAEWSARPGWAHLNVPAPTGAAIALYAGGMVLLRLAFTSPRGRRWWALACVGTLTLCAALWRPIAPRPEMTVIDVGHGDAIFVRAPGGATMLVDAGNLSDYTDQGRRTVAPFLWANHETHLDVLMVTHPDADHIGGALYLVENMPVGTVVLGAHAFPGTLEDALVAACERRAVPVQRVALGDRFALGGASVEVLHPPRVVPEEIDENNLSIVTHVSWSGFSALLTGDIESWGEEQLRAIDARARVIKVPHHGSGTSSSLAFLNAVQPELAVVSVAPRGRTIVLRGEVVQRYIDLGIPLLRTDVVGGVRIRWNAGGLEIEQARLARGYVVRDAP